MVVYTDPSHYSISFRNELFDFLKAFFNELSPEDRADSYGAWTRQVTFTDNPAAATLAILPMSWNFYIKQGKSYLAEDFIKKASSLKIISWVNSDFGVLPLYPGGEIFRASGYQSRRLTGQWAMPPFFKDPIQNILNRKSIILRRKSDKPIVGFCGQAAGTWLKYGLDVARIMGRNAAYYAHLKADEPQAILSAAYLRNKVLTMLENEPGIVAQFIRRKKYRAGVRTTGDTERTTMEFYHNLDNTDYTLCLRGGGNFSVRLYETLAMGRIPVFVDTDSILPWDDMISWKSLMVYVDVRDIAKLPGALMDFHQGLHPDDFLAAQQRARMTWVEHLSFAGFFNTLVKRYTGQG